MYTGYYMVEVCLYVILALYSQYEQEAQLDHIITFLLHPGITFNVSIISFVFFLYLVRL